VAATTEAVALWRAGPEPAVHDAKLLAMGMRELARKLDVAGRGIDAEAVHSGVAEIYETLAAADPEAHAEDYRNMLHELGRAYQAHGRRDEALDVARRMLTAMRRLSPAQSEPLGRALDSLGRQLTDLGRHAEAVSAYEEGVALARSGGDRHFLGVMLDRIASCYSRLGHHPEAVPIYRRLAGTDPLRYRPALAHTLLRYAGRNPPPTTTRSRRRRRR
jgi:tetratricopeptide (TPR) repeat protein